MQLTARPCAYPVPFRLERRPPLFTVVNVSTERITGVTLILHGDALMSANAPAVLAPGEALEVIVARRSLAVSSILVIRWFRPDGLEYLWRVSF